MPVEVNDTSEPRLVVIEAGQASELLVRDRVTIGRDPSSDIVIGAVEASRHHAVVERKGPRFVLRDLRTANGT